MKFKKDGQVETVSPYAQTIRNISSTRPTNVRPNQLRNTLSSPYALSIKWYKLNFTQSQEILDDIKRLFSSFPSFYPQRKANKQRKKEHETPSDDLQEKKNKIMVKQIRSQIKIGINEVSRSLEKGELRAVIIQTPQNSVLTDHLKVLSATRNVPVCVLGGLNETVCPILKWRQVSAIGFKKCETKPGEVSGEMQAGINKLVENITRQVPVLELPWLQYRDLELSDKVDEIKNILFPSGQKRVEFEFESSPESSGTHSFLKNPKVSHATVAQESQPVSAQSEQEGTTTNRKREMEQQLPPPKRFKYENPLRRAGYRKAIVQQRIKGVNPTKVGDK